MIKDEIEFKETISPEEFCALRKSVGFQTLSIKQAETVIENTDLIVSAVLNEKAVGIVRALTDTVTDAYITDVIVHPDFQKSGIGGLMIEKMLSILKGVVPCDVTMACSLYANAGKEPFYQKHGFSKLPNEKYASGMIAEF